MNKYCYIVISKTPTKIGYCIRKVGRIKYNHTAISLDPDLNNMFSFARRQHNSLLSAGFVKENVAMYSLRKTDYVDVVIFAVPISDRQYNIIEQKISEISSDNGFRYNYLSLLTYPIFKGLHSYKAFSCIEFVMFLMQGIGFPVNKPVYSYTPDDILDMFSDYKYYEGNLLDYKNDDGSDNGYFDPVSFKMIKNSGLVLVQSIPRFLLHRMGVR